MTLSWTFAVTRDDLSRTAVFEQSVPEVGAGRALLRVDRVGVTANNVTYGVLGKALRYWDFFPTKPDWGLVPLWGFAEVVASAADGVNVGDRVYGYLPPATHLLVQPDRADERGFRDASPHRAELPPAYNAYVLTTGDPAYRPEWENLQILYRPLFLTSFMLADYLQDNDFHGAQTLVFSSASSKTAYGTAFLLKGAGPRLVGLTSPGNVEFTKSLGCYDTVLPYDAVSELDPAVPTTYLDLAGSNELRLQLREHLGAQLRHDAVIGVTHQERFGAGELTDPPATVFFAPDQMRKRSQDWGRAGLDERFAAAWSSFVPTVEGWVDVAVEHGPEALQQVWLELLSGRSNPRVGHVLTL